MTDTLAYADQEDNNEKDIFYTKPDSFAGLSHSFSEQQDIIRHRVEKLSDHGISDGHYKKQKQELNKDYGKERILIRDNNCCSEQEMTKKLNKAYDKYKNKFHELKKGYHHDS